MNRRKAAFICSIAILVQTIGGAAMNVQAEEILDSTMISVEVPLSETEEVETAGEWDETELEETESVPETELAQETEQPEKMTEVESEISQEEKLQEESETETGQTEEKVETELELPEEEAEATEETEAILEEETEAEPEDDMEVSEPDTELDQTENDTEKLPEIEETEVEEFPVSETETEQPPEKEPEDVPDLVEQIPETETELETKKDPNLWDQIPESETISNQTEQNPEEIEQETVPPELVPETELSEMDMGTESELNGESETESKGQMRELEPTTDIEGSGEAYPLHGSTASESEVSYAGSSWDVSWYIPSDFRFTQVEKQYALVEDPEGAVVYDDCSTSAGQIGEIPPFGLVYILEEDKEGWSYIESGSVRGFVKTEQLSPADYTETLIESIGETAFVEGEITVEIADNEAFTYTRTTTQEVLAEKRAGLLLYDTVIYEYTTEDSRAIGSVSSGNLVYILQELDNGWCFVESGDARGFVKVSDLLVGNTAEDMVSMMGEDEVTLARELITPEENRSCYFTLTSTKRASEGMGERIAEHALQYVGRLPYVWGGTSLTTGADCSGFVQSIYASAGVTIPRLAEVQGVSGMLVSSVEDAKPGDVVYWASGPHVGIYIGNGKVVQCSGNSSNTAGNPGQGPTISDISYMPVTSIRRYLIPEEDNGGSYRKDHTSYSQEELELIWAIVAQEDNVSYEGALAVISSAMNRSESGNWSQLGGNALSQLTANGQYCYSLDDYWIKRLDGNVPDYVKQAVNDCLNKGIRNHPYTSFRSRNGAASNYSAVQIGGNWFFGS